MKVLIIESSGADDFYSGALNGLSIHHILREMGIQSRLRYVIDRKHFRKAIARSGAYDVVHISCHGCTNKKGLVIADRDFLSWGDVASYIQERSAAPMSLIMSACFGARIASALEDIEKRPTFVFGTDDDRNYSEYAAAWPLLYKSLLDGADRENAYSALRVIATAVHGSFVCRRWATDKEEYRVFAPAKRNG